MTAGEFVSPSVIPNPYGDVFWKRVAKLNEPRTASECFEAFLTGRSLPIARFTMSSKMQPGGTRRKSLSGGPLNDPARSNSFRRSSLDA